MRIILDYGSINMAELRNELRLHYRNVKGIWILVCSAAMLAGAGISLAELGGKPPWPYGWGFPLFVGGCEGLLVPLLIFPIVMPNVYADLYRETGNHLHIMIDETGIFEEVEAANVFHEWLAVKTYKEDANGFIIYFAGGLYVYVSRRRLADFEVQELKTKLGLR